MRTIALALALAVAGCSPTGGHTARAYVIATGGNPDHGERVIRDKACGACHTIPGVRGAAGKVGPPLDFFSQRTYIAGRVPNTPENLQQWILDPQSVDPQTAMPQLRLTREEARDVAAYLYTLD